MRLFRLTRSLTVLAVLGAAVCIPVAGSLARPRPQPAAEAPPPPPLPPPGPVNLPDALVQDAASYASYMRRAVGISPAFTDAAAVTSALDYARAYRPESLVRGAIAYAAISALQDPDFVASIRQAGNSPENRQAMVNYIMANPAYVYLFKSYDVAAGLARASIGPTALRLRQNGMAVRQASYDIQRQGWSKAEVSDLRGRLAAAEAAAGGDMASEADALAQERQSASTAAPTMPVNAAALAPPYTILVARALQLAAVAALGEATNESLDRLMALTVDDDATECLGAAKRNFHQCLAVAKPNYEDVFCTGQHALTDTGACMAKAAGETIPAEPAPPPAPPHLAAVHAAHSKTH